MSSYGSTASSARPDVPPSYKAALKLKGVAAAPPPPLAASPRDAAEQLESSSYDAARLADELSLYAGPFRVILDAAMSEVSRWSDYQFLVRSSPKYVTWSKSGASKPMVVSERLERSAHARHTKMVAAAINRWCKPGAVGVQASRHALKPPSLMPAGVALRGIPDHLAPRTHSTAEDDAKTPAGAVKAMLVASIASSTSGKRGKTVSAAARDETYAQLCKHVSANPNPWSERCGWHLFALCAASFTPSNAFLRYVVKFLLIGGRDGGWRGHYASYTLRRLGALVASRAEGAASAAAAAADVAFVPRLDQIRAFKRRMPSLIDVVLGDRRTFLARGLAIPPDLDVDATLRICTHFLGLTLRENTEQLGLWTYAPHVLVDNVGGGWSSSETHVLDGEGYVGDAVELALDAVLKASVEAEHAAKKGTLATRPARRAAAAVLTAEANACLTHRRVVFVLRRRFCRLARLPPPTSAPDASSAPKAASPSSSPPPPGRDADAEAGTGGENDAYERIVYAEAIGAFVDGHITLGCRGDASEVARNALAALALDLAAGEDANAGASTTRAYCSTLPRSADALHAAGLHTFIPSAWRRRRGETEWERLALRHWTSIHSQPLYALRRSIIGQAQRDPLFAAQRFLASRVGATNGIMLTLPLVFLAVPTISGLYLCTEDGRTVCGMFGWGDLMRWQGKTRSGVLQIVHSGFFEPDDPLIAHAKRVRASAQGGDIGSGSGGASPSPKMKKKSAPPPASTALKQGEQLVLEVDFGSKSAAHAVEVAIYGHIRYMMLLRGTVIAATPPRLAHRSI